MIMQTIIQLLAGLAQETITQGLLKFLMKNLNELFFSIGTDLA